MVKNKETEKKVKKVEKEIVKW